MNFKSILYIFLIFYGTSFYAQNVAFKKPNFKKIKKVISKKKSDYYYPKLMKRYMRGDNAMTIKEKRCLYYGYAFQQNYRPYAKSKYKKEIIELLSKKKRNKMEFEKLLRLTKLHLRDRPFDIEILRVQIYIYRRNMSDLDVSVKRKQIAIIKDALVSSGNGKTKATAFHVINTSHESELLKVLGYKQKGRHIPMKKFEYLKLESNNNRIAGLYFNVNQGVKSIN